MLHFPRRTLARTSLLLIALTLLAGCATQGSPVPTPSSTPSETPSTTPTAANSIVYSNKAYGFKFTLPISWTGYSIVAEKWEGNSVSTGKVVETGPLLSIRHPLWTSAAKRQDIPILIFTIKQWVSLTAEKFHVGAAPIPPSELARNSRYVFALPARYNYAFPTGFEEVEQILKGNPLKAK